MNRQKDTTVEALLEHLIVYGPDDIATVFARPPLVSGQLSAALLFLHFSGGRDRTKTWDIHRNEKRLC
jgi:hypothetical protein